MPLRMMEPSSGTYDASLKQFYDGIAQSLIPNMCELVDWLTKEGRIRKLKPSGSKVYFDVETRLSSGFGYRDEDAYLPPADRVDNVQGNVPYKRGIKGRIGLTFEALKFGKEGRGGFVDMQKQEMKGSIVMMRKLAQMALWGIGDGVMGKVAKINNSTAGVPTVYEKYDYCYPGSRWLIEGLKVIGTQAPDTRDSETGNYTADSDMTAAQEISSINSDVSITFASAVTLGNTDNKSRYLVEHQCSDTSNATEKTKGAVTIGTASSYRGPQGMLAMCDDGTRVTSYCGISESSNPGWKASKMHASGYLRSLTVDMFYQMFFKLSRKAGTWNPKVTSWMNSDLYRNLVDLLEHFTTFKARQLKPGFDDFDVMVKGVNIPIRLDHECPSYTFFLNPEYITLLQGAPPHIGKETGAMWRDVADKDNYEAVWRWIFNTFTNNRPKHGILEDLNVTITSV